MKKILSLAILGLISCTVQDQYLNINFSLANENVKSTGISETDEKNIDKWAIILFNKADASDVISASASGNGGITCTVKRGASYVVCTVVNYPEYGDYAFDPTSVESIESLKSTQSGLAEVSPTYLPMFGITDIGTVTNDASWALPVSRIASKVSIEKISLNMQDERVRNLDFTLKSIYLTNVFCKTNYGSAVSYSEMTADEAHWYNAMGWHKSGENARLDALLADRAINIRIAQGESYSVLHSYYCMPNPAPASNDSRNGVWSIRCTRLVIEALIGTKTYYYPVTIPEMARNSSYRITEAVIRKLGSLSPEEEIPGAIDVTLKVEVPEGWGNEYNISENS